MKYIRKKILFSVLLISCCYNSVFATNQTEDSISENIINDEQNISIDKNEIVSGIVVVGEDGKLIQETTNNVDDIKIEESSISNNNLENNDKINDSIFSKDDSNANIDIQENKDVVIEQENIDKNIAPIQEITQENENETPQTNTENLLISNTNLENNVVIKYNYKNIFIISFFVILVFTIFFVLFKKNKRR